MCDYCEVLSEAEEKVDMRSYDTP